MLENDLVQEHEDFSLPEVILGIFFMLKNDLMQGHKGFSFPEIILGKLFYA